MPAPQHLIDIIKGFHSDAVVSQGVDSADAHNARDLLALLATIPPVPVDAIVSDVLKDFVGYLIGSPDGFRVGGTNTGDALIRCFTQYQEDRGFEVTEGDLTVEGVMTAWTVVLGHSQ